MSVRKAFLLMGLLAAVGVVGCQQPGATYSQVTPPRFEAPAVSRGLPRFSASAPGPAVAVGGPRDWVPSARAKRWTWIIIHHSATPSGCAKKFDADHRARGFDELGYDFVIGNGTESGNGQVEVGPRWRGQLVGAHTKDPSGLNRYNIGGIGICLVGNFDVTKPTPEQLRSCARLVAYLMKTYHIPASRVLGHRDCKATDCPGRYFPLVTLRRMASQQLAQMGEAAPAEDSVAEAGVGGELMHAAR